LGSFGERLRREREMRGITVEEIAEATKIGSRSLRALEEEHFEQLPGGIFNRGFVRAYARYLGINEEQAVTDYLGAEAAHTGVVAPATAANDSASPLYAAKSRASSDPLRATQEGASGNWLAVALALAVLVGGIGGWRWYSARRERAATAPIAAKRSPAPAVAASAPSVTPAATSAGPAEMATDARSTASTPAPGVAPAAGPAEAVSRVSNAAPGGVPPTASPELKLADANGFVVKVRARERSWMSLASDDSAAQEVTLEPAAEKNIRAARRLVLKIGNLPGVEVSFNGQPVALAGSDKVRSLVFTERGLQQ
jgi:cytoskeleton protein RodZ